MFRMIRESLIGNLDSTKLKHEIAAAPGSIVEKEFGALGGRVYFIKPNDDNAKQIARLLNLLDTQPGGRAGGNAPSYFVGGDFILKRTDEFAQSHHNAYIQSLKRPEDYVAFTTQALQRYLAGGNEFSLRDMAVDPIRHALATGMFDTDGITDDFAKAMKGFSDILQSIADDFATGVFLTLMGSYHTSLFSLNSTFRHARQNYIDSIDKFILAQRDKILSDLHAYATGAKITNILSLSTIQLIREQHPDLAEDRDALMDYLKNIDEESLEPLLHDTYLRTVPGSIIAGDNTMILLTCGLTALATQPSLISDCREACQQAGLESGMGANNIVEAINKDKSQGGLLHRFYLECMRRESLLKSTDHLSFETITTRYTDRAIEFDDTLIQPKSMIMILSGMPRFSDKKWSRPEAFNPARFFNQDGKTINKDLEQASRSIFSTGRRMCPANYVTEYIFKSYIMQLVCHYHLTLTNKHPELPLDSIMDPSKITIQLTPLATHTNDANMTPKPSFIANT